MRRTRFGLLSTVVLLGLAGTARAADDDVKAIVTRAIKAHGGEETLNKYKAAQSKNKGKITIAGVGEVDFTQELSLMQPDKLKDVMQLEIGGKTISVVTIANGDKLSIEADGKAVDINDDIKEALKDAQHMMKAARLVTLLKDKDNELSLVGEVKVEDKPAVGIRVASKGHKDLSLFFNKDTGLLAKVEFRGKSPMGGKEYTEERIILEYEKTDGIPRPKKILVKHDGEKFLEAEVVEAKFLEKMDDSEFKK
jgi:hypothetical protein